MKNNTGKRSTLIYGNCKVYSPDGELMFLCLEKRINWYLTRNLATIVDTNPLSIQLNFEPNGYGNRTSEYYLSEKRNACVCCNEDNIEVLTKHHVVPVEYRKHMDLKYKNRSSHDIVVMCEKCHYDYENNYAQQFKKELEASCFIQRPNLSKDKIKTHKAHSIAKLLLNTERCEKIPRSRVQQLYNEVNRVFGHTNLEEIVQMNLYDILEEQDLEIGKEVLELQMSIEDFIVEWRSHFIKSMNPQFLPTGWDIYNGIKEKIC